MIEQKEKACNRCHSTTNGFYGDRKTKDGLRRYCRVCDNENHRKTYQRNKEIKKRQKQTETAFIKQLTNILGSPACDVKEDYSDGKRMILIELRNKTKVKLYYGS